MNGKRIRKVIVTGVATVTLVVPLALGGFNTNANTVHADGTSVAEANFSRDADEGAKEDAKEDAQGEAQYRKEYHVPKGWSVKDTSMHSTSLNGNQHKPAVNTSKKADNSKLVKKDDKQAKKAITKTGKQDVINHINKQARHLSANKRNAKLKVSKRTRSLMRQMKRSGMRMHGTKAPRGLKQARHPKFRKGSRVIIKANHMPGMKGAKGRVVGAYSTKLYAVNYRPTNHGKTVRDHKWVIGKEIKPSRKGRIRKGERVTLKANHMKNMWNAKAKIVGIHNGPAYMVNYQPKGTHIKVTNHKWLTQDELKR